MTISPQHDGLIGRRVFGGYSITELLGEGGMGAVFVAEHRGLAKRIAVKVLHEEMTTNRDIASRFLAEARAASALDHPNIIDVLDSSTFDDGRLYIALEYLDGKTLTGYCREVGEVPIEPALRILGQVCCGLEAAHYRGIVHRDLKPGNIMLIATELNPLLVKVLDFGIAKLSDPGLAGGVSTRTNAIAGTPQYMSPEQARGLKDADHRTDIYALGVIAYRMLTRRLPFSGDSLGEVVYQQTMSRPTEPKELRPAVPGGWNDAIMRALLSAPHNRQRSAREFAFELAESTPNGLEILKEVAPLFFSKTWTSRTRKLDIPPQHALTDLASGDALSPMATPPPPAAAARVPALHQAQTARATPVVPPGGTMPYSIEAAESENPPTTLSSSAGSVATNHSTAKRFTLVAAGFLAATVVLVGVTALVMSMNSATNSVSDEADAGIDASMEPDASVRLTERFDAAPPEPLDASSVILDASPQSKGRVRRPPRTTKRATKPDEPTKEPKKAEPKKEPKMFDPNAPLGGT